MILENRRQNVIAMHRKSRALRPIDTSTSSPFSSHDRSSGSALSTATTFNSPTPAITIEDDARPRRDPKASKSSKAIYNQEVEEKMSETREILRGNKLNRKAIKDDVVVATEELIALEDENEDDDEEEDIAKEPIRTGHKKDALGSDRPYKVPKPATEAALTVLQSMGFKKRIVWMRNEQYVVADEHGISAHGFD